MLSYSLILLAVHCGADKTAMEEEYIYMLISDDAPGFVLIPQSPTLSIPTLFQPPSLLTWALVAPMAY